MKLFLHLLLISIFAIQCKPKEAPKTITFPGNTGVPSSIKDDHAALMASIKQLTTIDDSSGRVAIKLLELMQHHFKEEEDNVLPALGLLPFLASGQLPGQIQEFKPLADQLNVKIFHLEIEHQLIKAHIDELMKVSSSEQKAGIEQLESALMVHAKTEEEIFFPAAIVIAKFLNGEGNSFH